MPSIAVRRTWPGWRRCRTWRRRRTRLSLRQPIRSCSISMASANSATRVISRKSSRAANLPSGVRSATAKTRATSRFVCRGFCYGNANGKANGKVEPERLTGRIPADDVDFREDVDGDIKNIERYCWGNPAYALAERITNAFALYKWTAAIRGVEGGGLVEGIPAVTFKTDEGDKVLKYPTETAITDRREKELNDLGFITLVHCKNTDKAAFFGGQTTQKPKVYQDPQATANAKLSSQLPYIMATSRFAHYIKAMMRDKVGSFMTKENVSDYLNKWIADYVLLDDRASQSSKASYPLREARVDVEDVVGKPGVYKAVVYLRPHFQLDELTASLRLVAELPPPVAG